MPSLIYVTHHIEEILPLFAKTLVLRDGRVLHAGVTSAVLKDNLLNELYGVSLKVIRKDGRHWPVVR
jgi:iron complex transport system ATP-binding protein